MKPSIPPLLHYLWQNCNSIVMLHESRLHKDVINHVMFTPDNRNLISLGNDATIKGINLPHFMTVSRVFKIFHLSSMQSNAMPKFRPKLFCLPKRNCRQFYKACLVSFDFLKMSFLRFFPRIGFPTWVEI